jgi:hypothetical protein
MIRHAALFLVAVAIAGALAAQSATSSLEDLRQRRVPVLEALKQEVADAPFSLGPVRLVPRLEVRELGYDNNIFGVSENAQSDWVARVAAGARLLLPVGSQLFLIGDALPGYDAYLRHSELRDWNGDYGVGAVAAFNRLSVEARAFDDRHRDTVSSEVLELADRRVRGASADVEIEVSHRFGLVGEYRVARFRYAAVGFLALPESADIAQLDRTETTVRAGLRYHLTEHVSVAGLVEDSTAAFARIGNNRENRSRAYLLALHYDRPRLYVEATGGHRRIEASSGSGFPEFSGVTGSFYAEVLTPAERLGLDAWGHRGIDYGLFQNEPYFRENLLGGGPSVRLGRRFKLSLFAAAGTNVYPVPTTTGGRSVNQEYNVLRAGAELSAQISRSLLFRFRGDSVRYNSKIAGLDFKVLSVQAGMSLNGKIFR